MKEGGSSRHREIAAELEAMIERGAFRAGERLPSTRALARAKEASAATVMQAYESLADRGLIRIRARSGYYVAPRPKAPNRAETVPPSPVEAPVAVSELVFQVLGQIRQRQGVPFGSAFPSPALFPLPRLAQDLARATRRMDPWRTVEDLSPGSIELRRQVAQRYAVHGMDVSPDDIVITSGAMEALNLGLSVATRPGDVVALESPAFYGALQAAERLGLRVVQVRTDPRTGLDLAALEGAIKANGVKACWLMPNLQNPLGATMPETARRELARLLARHGVALIEDDVYAELRFDAPLRPVKAFDEKGLVMHCGSFSKSLAPGYRVGWCVPGRFRQAVERAKLVTSIATSVPAQEGIAEFLRQGGYDRHLRVLRRLFAANQARFRAAIEAAFPKGTRISEPEGGYFLWVELPPGGDAMKLYSRAMKEGISIAPGPMFSASGGFSGAFRLNCGHPWDEKAAGALERLGRLAARRGI
jgi:DNA-binding transcriptional MocR family regulator